MYPTLSHLIYDLLGIYIPLPIQTFGFFMALSFVGAYITTSNELKRKEANGLIKPIKKKTIQNQKPTNTDIAMHMAIGAVLGYKLLDAGMHYSEFVADTQGFILSGRGNFWGFILGALWGFLQKRNELKKLEGKEQKEIWIDVHPHEHMTQIVFIAGIAGLLGAKVFHNLEYINDFITNPIEALLSFSGLTFYGGLIVAAVAVLYYTTRNRIPPLHMMDAAAPGLMLAYAIGRVGCQLSGDGDWGIENVMPKPEWLAAFPDWIWSYNYPNNVLNEGVPIPGCEGRFCNQLAVPVFPTPLYEVIMSGMLFAALWMTRKRFQIPGVLFSCYLILNGIERFMIEKIRVNSTYTIGSMQVTQAELISSMFILLGIVSWIYLHKKHKAASLLKS